MDRFSFFLGNIAVLFVAAWLFSPSAHAQQPSPAAPQQQSTAPDPHAPEEQAAESQALGFVGYLDAGRYAESYAYTSGLLRSRTSHSDFTQQVEKDRSPLGAEQSRKLLNASYSTSLQGQPPGQYVVLQYGTDFANKKEAVETLVLSFENGYWRVAGWFVK